MCLLLNSHIILEALLKKVMKERTKPFQILKHKNNIFIKRPCFKPKLHPPVEELHKYKQSFVELSVNVLSND